MQQTTRTVAATIYAANDKGSGERTPATAASFCINTTATRTTVAIITTTEICRCRSTCVSWYIPLQQELPQAHNTANSYINPVSLQAPQRMNRLSETAFIDGYGYATTNPEASCNFLEEKHIHRASSFQHGPVYTSNSLQQNPSLEINASNPEMQGQYLPIPTTVDRNTASLGAQQIQTTINTRQPVIVSNTEHRNLSPANSGQGLGIQFPPKSNVGCMSMSRSRKISNDQELIQSDPISCPQNQKGNN